MARTRGLKPDFFKDEDLACLPFEARLVFAGLLGLADREGRLEYRPKRIKVEIMPFDDVDIDAICRRLADPKIPHRDGKKFITIYQADGELYIEICNFKKHQRPHHLEPKSKLPANPLNNGITCQSTLSDGLTTENIVLNPPVPCSLNNRNRECASPVDKVKLTHTTQNTLELICAVYPEPGLKIGLEDGAAAEALDEIMPSEHGQVVIAAKNYAAEVTANSTAPQFVKQLSNFLRGDFWRNYVAIKPLGGTGPPAVNLTVNFAEQDRDRRLAEEERGKRMRGELPPVNKPKLFDKVST